MPLWSVQEWRARIGTSWCALGRPVRSKSSCRKGGSCSRSPPPGGGKRAKSLDHHGAVSVVIMIALLLGAILTLWHLVLPGTCQVFISLFVCTPMDLLLVQWILAMSLVSNDVSRSLSKLWSIPCSSDCISSFSSGFEVFPSSISKHGQDRLIAITYVCIQRHKRTEEKVVHETVFSNFWHSFGRKMRSIKQCLSSAMVKASLLLRCGDVEMNPGPLNLDDTPTIAKLSVLKTAGGEKIQIIKRLAPYWHILGLLMDFDASGTQLDIIDAKYRGDPEACCHAVFQHWVKGNGVRPCSWRKLIELIEDVDQGELAHKIEAALSSLHKPLTGDIRSELDDALTKGAYVMLRITKVLTTGAATAGKTCTKHYVFDKPPPKQYTSTDVFESMERHYAYYTAVVDPDDPCEWKIATLVDTLAMIKNYIRSDNKDIKFDDELGFSFDELNEVQSTDTSFTLLTTSNKQVHPKLETLSSMRQRGVIKKLLDPKLKLSGEVLKVHWIHFVDGGGQSEFLELLPTLVSNVTVAMYVIDLSRKPDDFCKDHFTINDRPQGTRQTYLTGEELFDRFFRTITSQKDSERCKVMFVGTHKHVPEAVSNLNKWNELINKFCEEHDTEGKVKIIRTNTNDNVHVIDANLRGKDGSQQQTTAKNMRKKLANCCVERKVAIADFLIEEDLKSSGKPNGILSYSECKEITQIYATENTLKKALQYFHELNEFLFIQREGADGLILTKPGVLVQLISRLIKVANHCRSRSSCLKTFWKWGIMSEADLKEVSDYSLPDEQFDITKYYRPKLFEGKELLNVLQTLFIAASCEKGYFIPCVLPPCSKDSDINKSTSKFMSDNPPLLVTFKGHSIPHGLFCGLVTYLMDSCGWKIRSGNDQNYRTLIDFEIPGSYKLVLVEHFKVICVHVVPRAPNPVRLKIRENIVDGVKNVSKHFYGSEDVSIMNTNASFECSCSCSKDVHIATVIPSETEEPRLICEKSGEDVDFVKDHYDWLRKTEDPRQPAHPKPGGGAGSGPPNYPLGYPSTHFPQPLQSYSPQAPPQVQLQSGPSYVPAQAMYPGGEETNVPMTHPSGQQPIHDKQVHVAANQGVTHGHVFPPPPYHGYAVPPPQHMHGHNYQGVGASSLQQYTQAGPQYMHDQQMHATVHQGGEIGSHMIPPTIPPSYGYHGHFVPPQHHNVMYGQSAGAPSLQHYSQAADTAVGDSSTDALQRKPLLHELDLLEGKSKAVKIIDTTAEKWKKFVTRLHFDGADIERIKKDSHYQCTEACREALIEWLAGKGRKPITWNTIIKALKEAGLSELAKDVREIMLQG